MGRTLQIGKWTAFIEQSKISTKNNFHFSPAEASKITGLLGMAGSMAELKALPEEIAHPPFKIQFMEEGYHQLWREEGGFESFSFEETDVFIKAINTFVNAALDMQRISPKPIKPGGVGPGTPDVFDGRN